MQIDMKNKIVEAVDSQVDLMWDLAKKLHANPELAFEEHEAVQLLSGSLNNAGFKIENDLAGLPTAFKASWHGSRQKPRIALLCEYDALPKLGHACGHNLIGPISIGAALALKKVCPDLPGSIDVIGTPAEEGGGGKVIMCRHGVFDDYDAVMMCHAKSQTMVARGGLAVTQLVCKYHGVSSHASSFPEKGISALDAVINTFVAINSLRQFVEDGIRIHGIITKGGDAPNVIPDYCEAKILVRAPNKAELRKVKLKVINAAKSSAEAVGAGFECEQGYEYAERNNNPSLAELMKKYFEYVGETVMPPPTRGGVGSSDIGDVSQIVPTLHPYIKICEDHIVSHSTEFAEAAIGDQARIGIIKAAKALALGVYDLCNDDELMSAVRNDFDNWKKQKV